MYNLCCLFVWCFSSHSRIFYSFGDVNITGERLQISTYKRHLCPPLSKWEFFSMPHILWHGTSVYNGHLRGPVTLTPVAERLAVKLSQPVLTTWVCRVWDSNTQPSACDTNALTDFVTAAARNALFSLFGWFFVPLENFSLVWRRHH